MAVTTEPKRKRRYRIVPLRRPEVHVDLDAVARRVYGRSRRELIAEAAYHRSLFAGTAPRDRERDWLGAEAEIDMLLRSEARETDRRRD